MNNDCRIATLQSCRSVLSNVFVRNDLCPENFWESNFCGCLHQCHSTYSASLLPGGVLTGLLLTLRQCSLLVFHNLAFVVRSLLEQCSFFLYQKFPFCVYCNWYCTAFFELAISAQYCLLASFILSFFCLKSCECFSSRFILSFFHFYICIEKMNIVGFDIWNL